MISKRFRKDSAKIPQKRFRKRFRKDSAKDSAKIPQKILKSQNLKIKHFKDSAKDSAKIPQKTPHELVPDSQIQQKTPQRFRCQDQKDSAKDSAGLRRLCKTHTPVRTLDDSKIDLLYGKFENVRKSHDWGSDVSKIANFA